MKPYFMILSTQRLLEEIQLYEEREQAVNDLKSMGYSVTTGPLGELYSKMSCGEYQEMRIVKINFPKPLIKPETEIEALTRQIKRLGEKIDRVSTRL